MAGRADAGTDERRIIDAIDAIVRAQGVRGLTVPNIARTAGLSPGIVRRRLVNRSRLLAEVLMLDAAAFAQAARIVRPRPDASLAERVAEVLQSLLRFNFTPQRRPLIRAMRAAAWEWDATAELRVHALARELLDPLRRLLTDAVAPGWLEADEVEPLLDLLIAAFDAAQRRGIVLDDPEGAERDLRRAVELVLGPREPPSWTEAAG